MSTRRATAADSEVVADLYLRARKAASAFIPPLVHSDDDVRRWIGERVIPGMDVWLVESSGKVVAMMALDEDSIDQLYVEPTLTGQGVGGELLRLAKRERPGGLRLWTFQSNRGARRFYERHGFSARDWTEGDNEEGEPDVLYVWDGRH
jgi:GNAT superfamily N-acetyltransferase